jgi:hypothetical protein
VDIVPTHQLHSALGSLAPLQRYLGELLNAHQVGAAVARGPAHSLGATGRLSKS